MLGDAPAKPEPLGVPEEPKLGVVADTAKGLYEERTKPKTAEWLGERGGTIESQKAVEDGLNWLARHQGEDGHWGADCLGTDPNSRCEKKAPCQETGQAYEIAQTGLTLLAFQAAGHYDFNSQKYSGQVAKGLDYFVQEQAPDGSIVGSQNPSAEQIAAGASFQQHFMYEHAMATFALCEACAVAIAEGKMPDPRYREAAQRTVAFIERIQHDDGGWRYSVSAGEGSDCSVSGWVMLALKTAREANISVSPKTISRMVAFFAANYADGQTSYGAAPNHPSDAMTGVGMMAIEFLEHKLDSPIVQWGAAYLADKADALAQPVPGFAGAQMLKGFQSLPPAIAALPASFDPSINYYLWYNCTMAMFQVGGEPWKRWNGAVRDRVISLQVQGEGCERGSWPPNDQYSGRGGRIYSTALAVLTLEVYYRFQRIGGQPEKEKFFAK
ncbi:MAG TPA: prenyltransferase/squalene oxidase repeat-containing protein [Pirellulales bacterium]|nr:prenyltransferase/squalene oxidase repeat-containing protein [Pirellulales bacterium]